MILHFIFIVLWAGSTVSQDELDVIRHMLELENTSDDSEAAESPQEDADYLYLDGVDVDEYDLKEIFHDLKETHGALKFIPAPKEYSVDEYDLPESYDEDFFYEPDAADCIQELIHHSAKEEGLGLCWGLLSMGMCLTNHLADPESLSDEEDRYRARGALWQLKNMISNSCPQDAVIPETYQCILDHQGAIECECGSSAPFHVIDKLGLERLQDKEAFKCLIHKATEECILDRIGEKCTKHAREFVAQDMRRNNCNERAST